MKRKLWMVARRKAGFEDKGESGIIVKDKMMIEVTPSQRRLRVAALSDIHGNIRALNAVLEEVER